jgi:hypothetical protein
VVKKKSEPFVMKRQGSELSVIQEKKGAKSNIYALNKGQGFKSPLPDNDYLRTFKSASKN